MAAAKGPQVTHVPDGLGARVIELQEEVVKPRTASSDRLHLVHPDHPGTAQPWCGRVDNGRNRPQSAYRGVWASLCGWCWEEWLDAHGLDRDDSEAIRAVLRELEGSGQ